jgi:hypothetical protein
MTLTTATPAATLPALSTPLWGRRSTFVAAALGWLLPGLGQVYVGRPGRGFAMFVAIGGLFYLGLWLSGFTAVNPETYSLEFIAHVFQGGPTAAAYYLTRDIVQTEPLRWLEVGRLYAAVAGLLNVVAICDAVGEVLAHNEEVRVQAELRERFLEERQQELDRMIAARAAAEAEAAAAREALREMVERQSAREAAEQDALWLPGERPARPPQEEGPA